MLTLALDTATPRASCALVRDRELLGESETRAIEVLVAVQALLESRGLAAADIDRIACGIGPGSFTGIRIGLAAVRGLALALEAPVAGVSTLAVLAAAAPAALPVIDGGRNEVFTLIEGEPRALRPEALSITAGTVCVGDGAVRYRSLLEGFGAEAPPDSSELHRVRARFLPELAAGYGRADEVEPLYVRVPDAEKALGRS